MSHSFKRSEIFGIQSDMEFNEMAMRIFHYQARENEHYVRFLKELDRPDPDHWSEIPCLPISTFKNYEVRNGKPSLDEETVFQSSGTTGIRTSRHFVKDIAWYEQSFLKNFMENYGPPEELCILGLLPSYLEREGSSLIYMVQELIQRSEHPQSGFYLNEYEALHDTLLDLGSERQPTLLIGVSFALLDFCAEHPLDFPELIVMETGGMKGRKKEMIREELHGLLTAGFGVSQVHSEYGMTELLSQAYSNGGGRFLSPPWMKMRVRDLYDPLTVLSHERSGGLDIIDLANVDSCAFISTDDLAKTYPDGTFEVLGRFDQSDIRGCSLLI